MAKIVTKLDSLIAKRNQLIKKLVLLFLFFIFMGIFIPYIYRYKLTINLAELKEKLLKPNGLDVLIFSAGGSAGALVWWFTTRNIVVKIKIINNGIKGEKSTIRFLKKLSNDYYIFNDILIKTRKGISQIDHVVIGSNGVFIIETKNHNGKIVGEENDEEWIQYKKGKQGGVYNSKFYNPIKQVNKQIHNLKTGIYDKLQKNYWVQPVVVFTNDNVVLNIECKSAKIIKEKALVNYINNYKNPLGKISKLEKHKIINTINELIVKN